MAKEVVSIDQGGAENLPIGTQMSYGVGQIAGQIFRDIPSLLLLFFMTNILGISPAIAGTAIFAPKLLVGVLSDVVVGIYIDKWRERVPLYRWLLFGAIAAPLAMILLFHVPEAVASWQLVYIVVVISLYMLVFASFSVPYLAIAAAIANGSHQRTLLMAWRLVFTAIGVLIAGGLAPAFVDATGGDAGAYSLMSIVLGGLCAVSLLIAFFGVRKSLLKSEVVEPTDLGVETNIRDMFLAVRAPRFSVLLLVNILQLTATGMSYAAMLYFLTYVMVLENPFSVIGAIILATTIGIIVGQPIWVALSKRLGKKRVYITATILHATALGAWALTAQSWGVYGALFWSLFIGVGNSGWVMSGFSMVVDIADEGRAGLFSSVWIAADKVGFAFGGTLLIGFILSGFGFDSARAVAGLPQTSGAITGVMVAFGLVPAILYYVSAGLFMIWGFAPPKSSQIIEK